MSHNRDSVRRVTVTGMLAALAAVLMLLSFSVPFVPSFLKMDLSELPALIGAFAYGPVCGIMVCLVKNLINVLFTTTGGVGELCNFLLGAIFVVPAGMIYRVRHTRSAAILAAIAGAAVMTAAGLFTNYYLVYPVYGKLMSMDAILGMYRAINPNVKTLWDALIWFNMPFTFIRGMLDTAICVVIYKPISSFLHGNRK